MTVGVRCAALLLAGAVAACGGSPDSPTSPRTPPAAASASHAGTWSLDVVVTDCSGLRSCWTLIGKPTPVWLRLVESAGSLEGVLSVRNAMVDVTGRVTPDGSVALSGFTAPAIPNDPGGSEVELRQFTANLSQTEASGTLEFRQRGWVTSSDVTSYVLKAKIIGASRVDTLSPGQTFNGTWAGRLAVRSCRAIATLNLVRICDPEEPDRTHPIELSLTQSGTAVNGHVRISSRVIPVAGRVEGRTLTLSGELTPGNPATTITHLSATADKLGRMRGTFSYLTIYPSREYSYDVVELWSVVLKP